MASVAGLFNLGNTCYLSAVLQGLASCSSLLACLEGALEAVGADAAEQTAASSGKPGGGGPALAAALLDCLRRLQPCPAGETPPHSFAPEALVYLLRQRVSPGTLEAGEEHDAAEATEVLLDLVQTELRACFMRSASRQRAAQRAWRAVRGDGLACGCSGGGKGAACAAGCAEAEGPNVLLGAWRLLLTLPCEGTLAVQMQCTRCRHRFAMQLSPHWTLPLSLPPRAGQALLGNVRVQPGTSLSDCLATFFGVELIHDVNCTRCSLRASLEAQQLPAALAGLQAPLVNSTTWHPESDAYEAAVQAAGGEWVRRTARVVKRHVAARLPRVLCLQLRRSFWSAHGPVKVEGHVQFALRLTLDERLAPQLTSQLGSSPANSSLPAAAAQGSSGAGSGDGSGGRCDSGLAPLPGYALRAVVVHHGFASTHGHYTVYRCLDAAGLEWVRANDEVVGPATAGEVLAAEATLLVYERLPAPTAPAMPNGVVAPPAPAVPSGVAAPPAPAVLNVVAAPPAPPVSNGVAAPPAPAVPNGVAAHDDELADP